MLYGFVGKYKYIEFEHPRRRCGDRDVQMYAWEQGQVDYLSGSCTGANKS